MATRVVEGKKPYTGGKAIEIDENKVISLRLRDENNLIIWDEGDNEIYVDLQLPDELQPTSAFPVGITTGRVIVDNGRDEPGTIICAKTTSGDNIKLLYADSGNLYIDNGTGTFKQIYLKADVDALLLALRSYIDDELAKKQNGVASATAPESPTEGDLWYDTVNDQLQVYDGTQWTGIGGGGGGSSNTKTFYLQNNQDLTTAQEIYDWYDSGKNPIIMYNDKNYIFISDSYGLNFRATDVWTSTPSQGGNTTLHIDGSIAIEYSNGVVSNVRIYGQSATSYLRTDYDYSTPYTPAYNGSPATKKYVDDSLLSTQSNNILQSGMKIWAGTEADYGNLGSYDQNTVYLTV